MRPFNRIAGNYWITLRDENLVSTEIMVITYFLTAPESTSVGILHAPVSTISDYTGLDPIEISDAIESLEKRKLIQTFFSDWYFIPLRWTYECIPTGKRKGVSPNQLEHAFQELQNVPKACTGAFHVQFPEFQITRLSIFQKDLHNVDQCNRNERDRDMQKTNIDSKHPLTDKSVSHSRAISSVLEYDDPELPELQYYTSD